MVLPTSPTASTLPMDDLEVRVAPFDPQRQGYPVQIMLETERSFEGVLRLAGLPTIAGGDSAAIVAYGLDLFTRLFAAPLDDAFQQAHAAARARQRGLRVRLWLNSDDPALHEVPWELLHYDASGGMLRPIPLATDARISFSRYLSSTEPPGIPTETRPLRVLLVIAAPVDLETDWTGLVGLDRAAEERDFRSRLAPMQRAGQIALDVLDPASSEQLHAAINQAYDIIIYFGHALHHRTRGTRLVLEHSVTRKAELYDSNELVRRLQQANPRPRLLILVACNTAAQHEPQADTAEVQMRVPTSLAARLVQQSGIPAVIAMQRLVDLSVARMFTHHLSEHLLRNGVIDTAVSMVRQRIYTPTSVQWSTPVLYMRNRDGQIFTPNARLEYIQSIVENPQFTRWQTDEFINSEAITVPRGQAWHVFELRPEDAPPRMDLLSAINRELYLGELHPPTNLVALLGQPRSGQTTVMQRITADMATFARTNLPTAPLALFINLSGYALQRGSNRLTQLILDGLSGRGADLVREVRQLLQQPDLSQQAETLPRFVFLLDGLDTISEPDRTEAARELASLAQRLPRERVLVSCTRDVFPAAVLDAATIVLMQPLTERQVLRFLRQRVGAQSGRIYRQILENRLIDLTTDPTMLLFVLERLRVTPDNALSRNQLLQDLLDQSLGNLPDLFQLGTVALRTITALAWELRWREVDTLHLNDVFMIMAAVRGERDYPLEDLFRLFLSNRLLAEVGQQHVRFVYPALHAYAAALALHARPDFHARLNDIIALCGVSTRLTWWEEVIYALAGALEHPAPLAPLVETAIRDQNSTHALLVARALRALAEPAARQLDEASKLAYIDICVARLDPEREPLMERRAQIATALGRLRHPTVFEELNRILTQPTLLAAGVCEYDHPHVRLAAVRALRALVVQIPLPSIFEAMADKPIAWDVYEQALAEVDLEQLDADLAHPDKPAMMPFDSPLPAPQQLQAQHQMQSSAAAQHWHELELATPMQQIEAAPRLRDRPHGRDPHWYAASLAALDYRLIPLLLAWNQALDGTAQTMQVGQRTLRYALTQPALSPLERSVAALALGDVAIERTDADLLLETIVALPPPDVSPREWQAALLAMADALTMFDADWVSDLLLAHFPPAPAIPTIPDHSASAIAYIAGRVRLTQPQVIRWLLVLLRDHPDLSVKAAAIQALGWIGTAQPSLGWLDPVLAELKLPFASDASADETVRRVLADVAMWHTPTLDQLASFGTVGATDPADSTNPANLAVRRGHTPPIIHLRRLALQALALIGDETTIARIHAAAPEWQLELRREWHTAAQDIRQRLRQAQRVPSQAERERSTP